MMPRCPICGVESERMDLHESTLHTESKEEVRAPGSLDMRDGFGIASAQGQSNAEAQQEAKGSAHGRSHQSESGFESRPACASAPSTEKQQSATPRTDAAYAEAYKGRDGEWITLTPDSKAWDFARQLERELAARDEELAQVSDMLQDARDAAQSAIPASAIKVLQYVSRGRDYVGIEPYPDAAAREALGEIRAIDRTTKP